jgi:hypothetical protein
MSQLPADSQPETVDFEIITQEEYQNQQADNIAKAVFGGEENAEKTGNLITQFVASYERQKHE